MSFKDLTSGAADAPTPKPVDAAKKPDESKVSGADTKKAAPDSKKT
ncbi:hypothetical protein [Tropicimonas sp. IMCC34043]|nr:hypothetical protein [Tropicimonas sp. IMCC34043]